MVLSMETDKPLGKCGGNCNGTWQFWPVYHLYKTDENPIYIRDDTFADCAED